MITIGVLSNENNKRTNSGLTCPPYGNKEHWNNNEVIKSCDDWIDECINRYICDYYLFVVDKTTKYHYNIVETIINKSHFGSNNEYVVLIKNRG